MPTIKKLYFSSGVSATAPSDLSLASSTVAISPYVDDAAFVTANGTASEGDIYLNTTSYVLRVYANGAWANVVMPALTQTLTNKTISGSSNTITNVSLSTGVTGTLPIANGGSGQTTADAALNAFLPSQTGNNGKFLKTDGSSTSWDTTGVSGGESVIVKSSTDYTILDSDGYTTIFVSTGASDRTMTLPTLADNQNRRIRFKKTDSGAGKVIIDGEGSETIEGATTYTLNEQYNEVVIQAYSTEWAILNKYMQPASMVRLSGGNGHGSTNTKIRRFTTTVQNVGSDITYADSATLGATFTINRAGVYTISYFDRSSAAAAIAGISKNSTQLTTSIDSITDADRLVSFNPQTTSAMSSCSVTVILAANDVIRAHTVGTLNSAAADSTAFIITQVVKF